MRRTARLICTAGVVAIAYIVLISCVQKRSSRGGEGHIELRPRALTRPAGSSYSIESITAHDATIVSKDQLQRAAAANPALRESEWFKATTRAAGQ